MDVYVVFGLKMLHILSFSIWFGTHVTLHFVVYPLFKPGLLEKNIHIGEIIFKKSRYIIIPAALGAVFIGLIRGLYLEYLTVENITATTFGILISIKIALIIIAGILGPRIDKLGEKLLVTKSPDEQANIYSKLNRISLTDVIIIAVIICIGASLVYF